jgi:uncharacterized phage protein (TIGR02220 family)
MENKKYYWIKLKTNFFNREDIDFMLSQENGCEYVVLYQMLCLNTANNNGRLETKMNEVIIPYDIKKIVRDCKYFDYDTVAVALDLYKKLGLIYEEDNKILKIANYDEMIGSETKWAEQKRIYRENKKLLENNQDKVVDNVQQEYRDKSIDNRDIDNKIIDDNICSPAKQDNVPYKEIIDYLNLKNNSNYRYTTKTTKEKIKARLNDGFTLEDFKMVIDKKVEEWTGTNMEQYLRPETLFGTKFESYLNQKTTKVLSNSEKQNRILEAIVNGEIKVNR